MEGISFSTILNSLNSYLKHGLVVCISSCQYMKRFYCKTTQVHCISSCQSVLYLTDHKWFCYVTRKAGKFYARCISKTRTSTQGSSKTWPLKCHYTPDLLIVNPLSSRIKAKGHRICLKQAQLWQTLS
jgi:hypothetical protein